jgi:hypothetical protein
MFLNLGCFEIPHSAHLPDEHLQIRTQPLPAVLHEAFASVNDGTSCRRASRPLGGGILVYIRVNARILKAALDGVLPDDIRVAIRDQLAFAKTGSWRCTTAAAAIVGAASRIAFSETLADSPAPSRILMNAALRLERART